MTAVLPPGNDGVVYLKKELKEVITKLAQESRKIGRAPAESDQARQLLPRLDDLLTLLENSEVNERTRQDSKINEGLKLIYVEGNNFHFHNKHVERARALSERWMSVAPVRQPAAQTAGVKREPSSVDEEIQSTKSPKRSNTATASASRRADSGIDQAMASVKRPPFDNLIWGRHGILHGLALKRSDERKVLIMYPEYADQQRPAKVFGHNDITVRRWFPKQLCAVFHGAHGQHQAGIHGDPNKGAYLVVVSGQYDDLDQDRGDVLFYSGSGSHANTNPRQTPTPTNGTKALHASLASEQPVRVLRSHSGQSRYAPSKGLRYDGLYRVTAVRNPTNIHGGLYEQFKLERISQEEDDLQIPLERCKARPNGQDLSDYDRIEYGYRSRQQYP
ncbi:E3 ubiquitin-protein ligase ORTHRUS 1 [Fulvia fulva]|nr:E3 ubiquitin-protein ligase ORTHRUS 1 [Fulvia fulva]